MAKTIELHVEERKRGTRCCESLLKLQFDVEEARQLSTDLQALAHPVRLRILDILASNEGVVCVCDLQETLPVKQPTISHHLKLLRDAGLIDCERQGLWAYYFIRRDVLRELGTRVTQGLKALM
ncbi:MAG: transcriptional regulator [Candidatus Fraserbacteria bacterium RBG_16_55_9]|uniref:Transcriptional regulator n=1 Tax=Fraserbacteria sp. (strain RBG_16_55_9) TaxID=1817864 RepID=A0A1F5UXZ6_FRAXR|nr:MAG: transcriptional regulator [Candidatus Fraserbacteria bacterium RBG_16_55_9]